MTPNTKLIPAWYNRFLTNIKNGVPELQAAKLAIVGQDALLRAKRTDPEFCKRLEQAKNVAPKKWG